MADTLDFLPRVDDAELREEIHVVLTQLQLLSESAAVPVGRSSPSSEAPVGPPGYQGLSAAVCPKEERSLFEHFAWRFRAMVEEGGSRKRLWFLLWEAEHALKTRTIPPSLAEREERVALVLNRHDEKALIALVLTEHEGQHSFQVHLALSLPQGWIEKVREDAGRDPERGFQRPRWRDLDEETRHSIVAGLRSELKHQPDVARHLGLSVRTIRPYWSPNGKAA